MRLTRPLAALLLIITTLHVTVSYSTEQEHQHHDRTKRGVPSLPDYFERRVKPRIQGGVGLVKTAGGVVRERFMPAILDSALTLGNAGVTAVSQLHRAAQPVVSESAAHFKHSYDEHIAPGVAASVSTLGQGAKEATDKMSVAILGHETHSSLKQ